jgi:predicted peroxiredoxin
VTEKLVIMVTHGPDDPEMLTIPFVMAGAALASDVEVVMGFQGESVRALVPGAADGITVHEFQPLAELLDAVRELGGQLLVCGPCVKNRGIDPEGLIDGTEIVAAARFIAEVTSATNSLVY